MEDIEKTIEEEAIRYIEHIAPSGPNFDLTQLECEKQAFESGAAFALSLNRWRKVSEELPEDNMIIIAKGDNHDFQDMFLIKIESDYEMSVLTSCYTEWKPII